MNWTSPSWEEMSVAIAAGTANDPAPVRRATWLTATGFSWLATYRVTTTTRTITVITTTTETRQ